MMNKRDVINTAVGGSSSSCKRKTPEGRDESPLLPAPAPGFPTANLPRRGPRMITTKYLVAPSYPKKRYYIDTDLRLGMGPHAPCTEKKVGGGGKLQLDLSMSSPLTSLNNGDGLKDDNAHKYFVDQSLKRHNEHVKGMLEEICKRENERAEIKLKEKDKELDGAREKIIELEEMMKSLGEMNHALRVNLEDVTRRLAVLEGGGNMVPAQQGREEEAES